MFPAPPKPLVQKASDSLEAIVAEIRKYNAQPSGAEVMQEISTIADDLFSSWSKMTEGRVK